MNNDFLLTTDTAKDTAKDLFDVANKMPIYDFHCHLQAKEIWENKTPDSIAELWLSGDHYKWRVMRAHGVEEKYITGNASYYDKLCKWAEVLPYCIGNPLYHWVHLELQRYFGIYDVLSPKTVDLVWNKSGDMIKQGGFTPRELIVKSNVYGMGTTDDPVDDLKYHTLLKNDDSFNVKVLPTFRPDNALSIDDKNFINYISDLSGVVGYGIQTFDDLKRAMTERISYFEKNGCVASDHGFTVFPTVLGTDKQADEVFKLALSSQTLTQCQIDMYKTALLIHLASEYTKRGWVMQLHIGALRNVNTKFVEAIGVNSGFDTVNDLPAATDIASLLNAMQKNDGLPKTMLFTLNSKDNYAFGAMTGNFPEQGIRSKTQFGAAWWFYDNLSGMRQHMIDLANVGILGDFVGMLTDSRSFLSYTRHEYFRRILCGVIGEWVQNGEYPNDMQTLTNIVQDICFNNAKVYFGV